MITVGLDAGTGTVKAVAFDPDRGVLGRGEAGYDTRLPRDGWAEHDPDDWWRAAGIAIRSALGNRRDVSALAISAMGGATVFLDRDGRPAAPAMINLDRRAATQHDRLKVGAFADAVFAANGNHVGGWNVAAKTAWLRECEPSVFARVRTITSPAGYLLSRATGERVQSATDAGIFDLFSLGDRDWSPAACAALDVDPALLPLVVPSLEVVGSLRPAAAADLGLSPDCVVVAGGEDTSSAAFAAGSTDPTVGYVSLGTAGVVGVVAPVGTPPEPRVLCFPHVLSDLNLYSGSMSAAGAALRWLSTITRLSVETLLELAPTVPTGSGGVAFLPYLAGELHPVNDPRATAVFAGMTIDTTAAHLARAVIEGSAGAIAHNLQVIGPAAGLPSVLRGTGRPTDSPVWCQSIADATGIPVETVGADGAPLGDAILAAAGQSGAARSEAGPSEAARSEAAALALLERHVSVHARYEPDPARHAAAQQRLALTQRLYQAGKA